MLNPSWFLYANLILVGTPPCLSQRRLIAINNHRIIKSLLFWCFSHTNWLFTMTRIDIGSGNATVISEMELIKLIFFWALSTTKIFINQEEHRIFFYLLWFLASWYRKWKIKTNKTLICSTVWSKCSMGDTQNSQIPEQQVIFFDWVFQLWVCCSGAHW